MKNPAKQIQQSEVQIRPLLTLYSKKNGTVVEFCKVYKIHKATFHNWRSKYSVQSENASEFIPIQFNHPSLASSLFAEIELASNVIVRIYQRVDDGSKKSKSGLNKGLELFFNFFWQHSFSFSFNK